MNRDKYIKPAEPEANITTIAFDLCETIIYGVYGKYEMGRLVEENTPISKEAYCAKDSGLSWDLLKELSRGKMTEDEYWEKVVKYNRWDIDPEVFKRFTDEVVKITVPGVFDLIYKLHAKGYRLVIISDLWPEFKDRVLRTYPHIPQLFQKCFWSCDYGKLKSDWLIEDLIRDKEIIPQETIFIDDYEQNIICAELFGVKGIQFCNHIQLREELTKLHIL